MSESDVLDIKYKILDLFSQLDETELEVIEKWISSQSYKKDLCTKKLLQKSNNSLVAIANAIKNIVPFQAEMDSETIVPPLVGDQADCNRVNICHVDAFLYDEEDVEKLVKEEKLKKSYCLDCHSRNIKDLTYISHSMSRESLQYIFKVLLPKDLEEKQLLDLGSRFGSVLYGAYYFSNASTIVGVEMNKECCEVQERIIGQFSMDANRVQVIHSDILDRPEIVRQSDMLIINVMDFFVDIEKHKEIWYFLKKHVKKGSYLVLNRSMADTLSGLDIFEEFMNWLSICKPHQLDNEVFFDIEEVGKLFLYTVN